MIDFNIDLKEIDKFLDAVTRYEKAVYAETERLPKAHSMDYYSLLNRNIISNRYANTFPKLSNEYAMWKAKVSSSNIYWKLFGDLQKGISIRSRRGTAISVGIREGAKTESRTVPAMYGSGSKILKSKSIEMIGRVLEYGLGFVPSRPLWELTRESYWKTGYSRRVQVSWVRLKQSWY